MKWGKLGYTVICLCMMMFCTQVFSQDVIELKLSHFCPTTWPVHPEVLVPWTKKIESLTGGRIKFTIYPNETMGNAQQLYDFAVNGNIDIACSITEYTPGRFPLSSCMELPFLGARSAQEASLVYWSLYKKYLENEFKDTHILWLFCHGPGQLHTTTKPVKTLEDLKGLKIRAGDPTLARVLTLLGATPVICSVQTGYTLLKENKLDGAIIPWEGATAFGYLDFCKYHTEIDMYVLPFFVTMNKAKYESLPADIQKVIDNNSGEEMAVLSGQAADRMDFTSTKSTRERGDMIYPLPLPELERWKKITTSIGDDWVQKMEAKGLPGQRILSETQELFEQVQTGPTHKNQIILTVLPFGPAEWCENKYVLKPWARHIEQVSDGKINCIFLQPETNGAIREIYNRVLQGEIDIACSPIEYFADQFPLSTVMTLPFLDTQKGESASLVFWRLYKKYLEQGEFKDIKVLWLFCSGFGQLHTVNKPIRTVEDLKGLRVRVPGPCTQKAFALLGASPVKCTIIDGYAMLKDGKLDALSAPWEGARTYGYMEYCKHHTEINLYASPFFVVMNKNKYNSLPVEIKKAIDENSGEAWAVMAGRIIDEADTANKNDAIARGDFFYLLPADEMERWKKITMPVGDEWIREMQIKGLPGQEIIAYVDEAVNYVNNLLNQK